MLWIHVPLVTAVGFATGGGSHVLLESSAIAVLAFVASSGVGTRTIRSMSTTVGLMTSSALLVHFSGGLIEMHFHFFIMVAAVALYQSWVPFLIAILYVLTHHGVVGTLFPEDVFNHASAIEQPWKWAGVHALFVAAASAVGLVAWRLNESAQEAASKERYRSLVEALPATFYTARAGAEGAWTYVSPQIEALLGFTPDEWTADPRIWINRMHPDDREWVLERERAFIRSGIEHSLEYRMEARDGREVWVRDEATLIDDESTSSQYLQGFMLDITDRKWAEADAVRSKAYGDAIVQAAVDGIIVADRKGHIREFNPAAERAFGYRREDVLGKDLATTIVPPSLRAAHKAGLARYIETGESRILGQRLEVEGMRSDGSTFPVELSVTADRREDEDVLVAYLRDITDRKEAEAQLAGRALRQSAVVDLGHLALSAADVETLLDKGVGVVGRVLGADLCQVFEILPDDQLRLHSGHGWPKELIGTGTIASADLPHVTFTLGSDQPVVVNNVVQETRFSASPTLLGQQVQSGMSVAIRGTEEEPFGVLGAYTKLARVFTPDDVQFLQAVANIFSTAIRRKAAEYSRSQLEEQLVQVQKMDAIGQLAGGIAHDFNNLLAVINGYTTFVTDEMDEDDPSRDDLQQVLDASERGSSLVRQLLTFSRKEPIRLEVLDVNSVMADVTKMLERTVSESIELELETRAASPHALIDRGHMEQILMNLAVNAKDAMPGGGRLYIESSNVILDDNEAQRLGVRAGAYVSISVTDDGSGIPESVRAQIFDPFFTTKEKGAGTGLGLATVYGIVERAGGSISVTSVPNAGTTFTVYLPQADPPRPEPEGADLEAEGSLTGRETVLLVEDEEQIRALVERVLQQKGYDVISTTSPVEALKLAAKHESIDLLLSDVVMPQLSGRQLSETLSETRDFKTLYMSGYDDDIISSHGLAETKHGYLLKPFGSRDLLKKVREVLDTP